MKPQRIILIRHGESLANLDYGLHATVPDHKIELSPKGHEQSFEAGKKLREIIRKESVQFYVSPFKRCRQTLSGIHKGGDFQLAELVGRVYESDDLREQEWGNFHTIEETKKIEAERELFGTYFYRIPNGESGADVCTRLGVFLNTLHRDFEKPYFPQNAVIVSHGLTNRLLLKRWFHWTVDQYEDLRNPHNCEFFILERYVESRPLGNITLKHRYRLMSDLRRHSDKERHV